MKYAEPGGGKAWLAVEEGGVGILDSVSLVSVSARFFYTICSYEVEFGCSDMTLLA